LVFQQNQLSTLLLPFKSVDVVIVARSAPGGAEILPLFQRL